MIKENDIKIVFFGKGKFICNLLINNFNNKNNINNYILFKYYSTLV